MKKKITGGLLLGLAFFQHMNAQLVDAGVLKKYQPGVVSKIAAITKQVLLPAAKQDVLGAWFQKNDSLVAAWLVQGRPAAQIDSLQNSINRVLPRVLSTSEMIAYSHGCAASFAAIASEGEMKYLQDEYKPDSGQLHLMQSLLKDKYNFIYLKYLLYQSEPERAKSETKNVNKIYDTYTFYPGLYANRFVSAYLASIKGIKPIPDTSLQKIRNAFYARLKSDKYADWGKSLADITRYFVPDTAVFSHLDADLLKKEATAASALDKYKLVHEHHISYSAFDHVYRQIWEKNYKNALLQYTYGAYYPRLCDSFIDQNSQYYDSSITASLIRDGCMQSNTQFGIALKYKEVLKLRPELTDSLVACVMQVKKMRDSATRHAPYNWLSTEVYESQKLTALLTEEQYTSLLAIKHRSACYTKAQRDWDDLARLQLTKELNKETTISQLTNYYIARASTWTRLEYDRIARTTAIRTIEENKPQALKMLEQAKWKTQSAGTASGPKLQW